MNYLKKIIAIILVLIVYNTHAQQDPKNAFYTYQMNLVNPAFAGAEGKIDIVLGVHSYWTNVKGAPESQSLIFAMPLTAKVGVGVSLLHDQTFIEKQTKIAFDYGYKIKLNPKSHLFLGVKASLSSYNANMEGLTTYGIERDPSLEDVKGGFFPNIGAGLCLQLNKYSLSVAVPQLLASNRLNEINGDATYSKARRHYYLATGYDFYLSEKVQLKATTLVRYVPFSPLSMNLTGEFSLGKYIGLGAFYDVKSSVGGMFVFRASDKLRLGYAYDRPTNGLLRSINNGTSEVFLKLSL